MSSTKRRFLRAIQGERQEVADTPAQRFGTELQKFLTEYLKKHSGLDAMNCLKVMMQLSAKMAYDHGAQAEDFAKSAEMIFDEVTK